VAVVTTPAGTARCLRSDARENRDRILAAAAQAFAEEGLSVSLVEIARRAGVGNATLHRNFTKEQLVEELFQDWYARRRVIAERALADPDPWHGLASCLEDVLADGTCNRAIGVLLAVDPGWRERFRGMMNALLTRAQEAGAARADLTAEDLSLALLGVVGTMSITGQNSPEQWRRHLAILLDGMKARHSEPLPGLPLSPDQLDLDLREWSCGVLRNGNAPSLRATSARTARARWSPGGCRRPRRHPSGPRPGTTANLRVRSGGEIPITA
jgi:AcrR family transcriptional regulator